MTYRFQSKAAGDILMLDPAGEMVLGAMGVPPAAKGILAPSQMSAAIRAIEAALAQEAQLRPAARGVVRDAVQESADTEAVSLRRRAWPLVDMMRRAHAAGEAIVWGV